MLRAPAVTPPSLGSRHVSHHLLSNKDSGYAKWKAKLRRGEPKRQSACVIDIRRVKRVIRRNGWLERKGTVVLGGNVVRANHARDYVSSLPRMQRSRRQSCRIRGGRKDIDDLNAIEWRASEPVENAEREGTGKERPTHTRVNHRAGLGELREPHCCLLESEKVQTSVARAAYFVRRRRIGNREARNRCDEDRDAHEPRSR